jgi:5-(carboxyamino)imidazole ribonucleotide mutase
VAIGSAGAKNAGHLAARILGLADADLAERIDEFRGQQAAGAEVGIDPRG